MKANELRAGNWVIIDTKPEQLDEDAMEVLFAARNFSDLTPIPLSPEVLEKCGFDKDRKEPNWFKANGVPLQIFEDMEQTAYGMGQLDAKIKHLHQLQNLYFALTGEELDYQP